MQLNVEQRKLVQSKPAGHSLIKGVAGSGKTTWQFIGYLFCWKITV